MTQREIYKLVERLFSYQFENELELLCALVRYFVGRKELDIIGGRVWELDSSEDTYRLRYQFGEVEIIPDDYSIKIVEQPVFDQLSARRTVINYETDVLLLEKGIHLYSATGVGELIKRRSGKFYNYALAFNGINVNQDFFDILSVIGSAATTALRNLTRHAEQEKLKRDLDKASEIQKGLLPDHTLSFFDYNIFGISLPDNIVGGDYFDYLTSPEDDERVSVVISDAASKGLPAAIQALFVSGAIRMGAGYHTKISSLISHLNKLLYETFPFERFVTLFYCELTSSQNGLVLFANAGHCSPLHYSSQTGESELLNPTGGILGIIPEQKFRVENINMNFGDILLLFTDGIVEAQDKEGNLFGYQRLAELLKKHSNDDAKSLAYRILEATQSFSAEAIYSDDSTVVVIKREHPDIKTEYTKVTDDIKKE
ncbi:MAG: serine/threonine-protein phosphatase [Bacteroidetes bacterium]|nr:serine/threonine-protein phosphatase [Bacteroidota bacterium]